MTNIRALCRKPAVLIAMGWGHSTLYQRIQEGLFVAPVKSGSRASAWPSDEITAIQDAYIAGLPKAGIRGLVTSLLAARGAKP